MQKQIKALKAENLLLSKKAEFAREARVEMKAEIDCLKDTLEQVKRGFPDRVSAPGAGRREETGGWLMAGSCGGDGNRSAPVIFSTPSLVKRAHPQRNMIQGNLFCNRWRTLLTDCWTRG